MSEPEVQRELAELEAEVRRYVAMTLQIAESHPDANPDQEGMGPLFATYWPAIARALRKEHN